MAVDVSTSNNLSDATDSLEHRMQRIEFYLYGSYSDRPDLAEEQRQQDRDVFSKIEQAQTLVEEWSRKSQAFADLLSLCRNNPSLLLCLSITLAKINSTWTSSQMDLFKTGLALLAPWNSFP